MTDITILKSTKNKTEYLELKKLLKIEKNLHNDKLLTLWKSLNRVRNDLKIPQQVPIQDVLKFYKMMEEIRNVFKLSTTSYSILNELYVEIVTIRDMLNLTEDTKLEDILNKIKIEQISDLGIGKDSLLEKMLLIYSYR